MEACVPSNDAENRITVGGKRKSSGRRSSILKATKSPMKAGALEDLDPNSLDDNARSKSKKSRRSPGRRVSFAEKNEIKEFFVEDWQSAWKKEVEKNNLQASSSTSQGEYREPAESIKGLDTLLKGEIQEDSTQVCQVELQKMPEVQFNQISETTEDNTINFDRGVLLQTITQEQVQHTGSLDITFCHGGIVSANSNFGPEMSGTNPKEKVEEMEHTTCYNSSQFPQNVADNPEMGDQTRIFSGEAGVEVDVTCSQREIFFRDYPNALLSSPTNVEESGKMDSKSFLMSLKSKASTSNNANSEESCKVESKSFLMSLKSKASTSSEASSEESGKMDSKSFLTSLKSKASTCSNANSEESCKMDSKSFLLSLKSKSSSMQENEFSSSAIRNTSANLKRHPLGEITDMKSPTGCTSAGGWNVPQQHESEFDDNVELTTCHSYEVLDNSMQKKKRRSIYEPADVDVTACYGPGLIKSSERQELPENTGGLDMTSCYGGGILPSKQSLVVAADHAMGFTTNTENTGAFDFTASTLQVSQSVMSAARCSKMDSSLLLRSLLEAKQKAYSTSSNDELDREMDLTETHGSTLQCNIPSQEENILRRQASVMTTKLDATGNGFATEDKVEDLCGPVDQLDMTNCYGSGILQDEQSLTTGADQTVVFATNTGYADALDFTICRGQDAFSYYPGSNLQTSQTEFSNAISNKVDSSIFLRSLLERKNTSVINSDEHGGELDLTVVTKAGFSEGNVSTSQKRDLLGKTTEVQSESGPWNETQVHGDNLELTSCHSYKILDHSMQKAKRRSIYEPANIDVTSCYGPGLAKSPVEGLLGSNEDETSNLVRSVEDFRINDNTALNKAQDMKSQRIQQQPEEETFKFTTYHLQDNIDNSVQKRYTSPSSSSTNIEESGKMDSKSFVMSLQSKSSSFQGNEVSFNATGNTSRQPLGVITDLSAVPDCGGWNETQSQKPGFDDNDNVELTTCQSFRVLDSSTQKTKRKSIYEPTGMEVTSCYGTGVITSPFKPSDSVSATLNLTRCLEAATRRSNNNSALSKARDLQGQKIPQLLEASSLEVTSCYKQEEVDDNIELTTCRSFGVLDNSIQKSKRKSVYEPAGMDVKCTSCYGSGMIKSPFKQLTDDGVSATLNLTGGIEAPVHRTNSGSAMNKSQDLKSKKLPQQEEPLLEATTCYNKEELDDNVELTTCRSFGVLDNSVINSKRKSIYEPAGMDVTSCYGSGMIKSPFKQLTDDGVSAALNLNGGLEAAVHRTNSGSALNKSQDLKSEKLPQQEEPLLEATTCYNKEELDDNVELTTCRSFGVLDNSVQKSKRKSIYEPAGMDVTSCYGSGMIKLPFKPVTDDGVSVALNLTGILEAAVHRSNSSSALNKSQDLKREELPQQEEPLLEATTCYNKEELDDNVELTTCRSFGVLDNSVQKSKQKSLYDPAGMDVTSSYGSGMIKSPFKPVKDDGVSVALNLTGSLEVAAFKSNSTPVLNKSQDLQSEKMPQQLEESKLEASCTCRQEEIDSSIQRVKSIHEPADTDMLLSSDNLGLNISSEEQAVSEFDPRKLSIINEETEDGNRTEVEEMEKSQIVTQKPITLKEFLDITEIVFITEVNTRRSIAPTTVLKSAQTPKEKIVSSLVSAPKVKCYEEAIAAVESQTAEMKDKVEQQEKELNASNPQVFMEAQSATKEEILKMRNDARRLRSACEKMATREWKEGKNQLNKKMVSKLKENYRALAADVHVVEESLAMVDDCFKLLDNMDENLDKEIDGIQSSLDESEKKLEQQTKMAEEMQVMTEALQKSEQEISELERKRSSLQREKEELENKKEELKITVAQKEEELRLLKIEVEQSSNPLNNPEHRELQNKLDFLESIQEWELGEWNEQHAKFTFLKETVELLVLFGPKNASTKSDSDQEVHSIQLHYAAPERVRSFSRRVHTLLKQSVSADILTQMCGPTKRGLPKVLAHMSDLMYQAKAVGHEIFKFGFGHLISFRENGLVVEFSTVKGFVKFVLDIQLELQLYPEGVTFTVAPKIGRYSQTELEETFHAVKPGPFYLSRLVETGDKLIEQAKANPPEWNAST